LGDLNDERKKGAQSQISARAVGSGDYSARDLAYVHPEMQHGSTRLLTGSTYSGKLYARGGLIIHVQTHSFDICSIACYEYGTD
jgi:hypothetical protein